MGSSSQVFESGEDLEGWIALDSLIDSDDLASLILDAYSFGVAVFKIVDLRPYIPEDLKGKVLLGLAIVNEG